MPPPKMMKIQPKKAGGALPGGPGKLVVRNIAPMNT